VSLTVATNTATVREEGGSAVVFDLVGGVFTPQSPRTLATLVQNANGTYTLTRQGRTGLTFDSTGKLTGERSLDGYNTAITYPSSTSMVVTEPAGRTLTYTKTGTHVTSISDNASPARTTSYTYDGSGNLTDVVDVGSGHWVFGYDASHRMTTIHDANPDASARRLYHSALEIGRDHIASTVNTLVLAYAGASLPLLVLFAVAGQRFGGVITSEVVAEEVVRTLVGSVGLVASVPVTTALSALVVTQQRGRHQP
jgi:YD repeat-containing protein